MKMNVPVLATTALSLIVGCVAFSPVQAAPNGQAAPAPGMDVFSNVTPAKPKLSAAAQKVASMTPAADPIGQRIDGYDVVDLCGADMV